MMLGSSRKQQDGFTLIEIMVVIAIIGLLATLVVQSLRGATDRAKRTKAMADIAELKTALDRYYIDNGSYPSTDQGLTALVTPPNPNGPPADGYVRRIPADPWGNQYVYQSDGNNYSLKSLGADGAEGGSGKNADIDASQL
jgi:general secretion pathway protein G